MQHRNLTAALLCCAVALCAPIRAQQPAASPKLSSVLQRLSEQATALQQKLPSFTCDEAVISQQLHNGKVRRHAELTGTLRMVRDANGELKETYDYKGGHRIFFVGPIEVPFTVKGGFDKPLTYFLPSLQACYRFSLSAGRIDFIGRTGEDRPPYCLQPGLKGFALIDADGNVTHIERVVPPDVAATSGIVPKAAIDLAPVALNGHTYELSHHMVAERQLADETYRFEATYSNCRLFAATVTIGPATAVPPDNQPAPPK